MFNSFSSALSAMKAHSVAIDTVGHNLSNVNTTGFKSSDVAFKDIVAESMGGSQSETGMGVSKPITVRNFAQGAVQSSSGQLDAALQGSGFFVVNDVNGNKMLTRDGAFVLKDGYVCALTGERVQQYVDGTLTDIQIPTGPSGASATTGLGITANISASTAVGDSFSTPVEVVDSLGGTHVLTFKFTKEDVNEWSYDIFIPGADVGDTDPLVSIFGATPPTDLITFDAKGRLTAPVADPGTIDFTVGGLVNGSSPIDISWNFFNDAGEATITQFTQASGVSPGWQNGYSSGEVVNVGMVDGGKIVATYGNGQKREVASLAIAMVANPASLSAAGNNTFRLSIGNEPTYGVAETGGRGKVKASSLEASTVDIAREFTNLIIYQRGYQANSRVITTADELSQETLNLKR